MKKTENKALKQKVPQTLVEAILYYTNELRCVEFLAQIKWKDTGGIRCCTRCGSTNIVGLRTRPVFQCRERYCRKQFSIKVGTVMNSSNLPITKWVPAIWLIVNNKNGISSHELGRGIGVTQKTAWFMLHRIRESISNNSLSKLSGTIEIDESFVGGLSKNMHKSKREKLIKSTGGASENKTTVMGIIQRNGEVRAQVIPDTKRATLIPEILKHVDPDAFVYTDSYVSYHKLHELFGNHKMVDHMQGQYVVGDCHTNSIESFWNLLKRMVKGTYIQISPKHLNSYVVEEAFRFNTRKETDAQRFARAAEHIFGKRLPYKELIARKPVTKIA
jgi:transposase-like protein